MENERQNNHAFFSTIFNKHQSVVLSHIEMNICPMANGNCLSNFDPSEQKMHLINIHRNAVT